MTRDEREALDAARHSGRARTAASRLCHCTPSRGLSCRTCYAPHFAAGLHLAGLSSRSLQLIADRNDTAAAKARELLAQRKDNTS